MGESTNESMLRELGVVLDARDFPETWNHGAFLASWGVVAFDEPRSLEGDLEAISRRLQEPFGLAAKLDEHARRYQETREPIAFDDAVALAERIKSLPLPFDGRADYIAFLAGQCLTLQEGQAAGEVFTGCVVWEAGELAREAARVWEMASAALKAAGCADATPARGYRRVQFEAPPKRDVAAGWWRTVILAVPVELRFSGPDSAFGVQSASWLHRQCEAVARERARLDFPPGSLASRLYGGGDFAIPILDVPVAPVRDGPAVSVVPVPVEATICKYIERAASNLDHRDALTCVVDVLTKCGQPLGDALGAWNVEALRGRKRPDARTAAKAPAKALRNQAIIVAVRALERFGLRAMTPEREPGPACDVVREVFGLQAKTVLNIWKSR